MVENSFRASDRVSALASPNRQTEGLLEEFLGKTAKPKAGQPVLDEAALQKLTDGTHKGLHNMELYRPLLYAENLLAQSQGVTLPSELKKLQDQSNAFLQKLQYKDAIDPLKKEIELLRKLDPKEESEQFVTPFSRLAMSLREASGGKGDKEAEKLSAKALGITDKHPAKEGTPERQRQDVYRALIQEGSGVNDSLLAKNATDPKERKAYFEKAEAELTAALKVLNANDFKDNPYRMRALTNLIRAEDELGHKEKAQEHMKELREHPLYQSTTSRIDTGLLERTMAQAREKSPALRGIDAELQKCPWGKKVKPVVNTQEGARESVQYDGENYRIAVGDRVFPPEEIPQKYAFSATQAYRQQLFRLFSADTPVDQNTYTNVQVENLVAAHRAEIKVAAETNPGKPVMFISEDGTKVDLRTKSDEDIGKLLRGQKFLQRFWQDSFAAYSKKYGEFKQKLIAEGNLVEGY